MNVPRHLFLGVLFAGTCTFSKAAEKLTVQLDWLPGGDKSFVYAGVKEGFFAEEGLEVNIVPGRGSADAITKISTGSADVGMGGLAALMVGAAESGAPVKAVMSLYSKQPDVLFTTPSSGIKSIKDVEGKTLATPTFSSSNTLWPVLLEMNSVDPAKVKVIKVDPSALAPMLAQRKVDATINWAVVAPNTEAILKQAGTKIVVLPWSAYGLDGYGLSLFASDKLIKTRPETLRRYLRALRKSVEFSIANPEKTAADLKALVPEIDTTVAAAELRASIPLLQNEISKRDGFGALEPKLLSATWTWVYKSMHYAPNKLAPEKIVDRSFLPK